MEFSFGEEPREGDRVKRRRFLAHRHTYGLSRTILQSCLFSFTISELFSPSSLVNTYTFSLIHFIFSVFWATMRAAEIEFLGSVQQIWASHFDLAAAGDLNSMVDMFWTTAEQAVWSHLAMGSLIQAFQSLQQVGISFLFPQELKTHRCSKILAVFISTVMILQGFFAGAFSQAQAMGCSNCIFGS